jgi:hypothetical protein
MAGLLNMSSMLMCPHGGTVSIVTSNSKVMVGGDLAVMSSDTFIVAGCPFIIGLVPHPCVQIQWVQPAARSQVLGDFTLTEDSVGLCIAVDESVQGTVLIMLAQPQVAGE